MKKLTALMLLLTLALVLLAGCSGGTDSSDAADGSADFQPESTVIPSSGAAVETDEPLPRVLDVLLTADLQNGDDSGEASMPESPEATGAEPPDDTFAPAVPAEAPEDTEDEISFTYEKLADTSFGFTFAYPIGWENLPGKHTVCFRENNAEGFATRVSVTAKNCFAHKPKVDVLTEEFQDFIQTIYTQYDPETFELGTPSSNVTFMGNPGLSVSYLAYSGEHEVYGYACCTGIGKNMYVFHFICNYDDSEALKSAMFRMRDSVAPVE